MNRDDFERWFKTDAGAVKEWASAHPAYAAAVCAFIVGFIAGAVIF